MVHIGLTGGIASGKSFVADALRERGAEVIDSDVLAREVVEPGTPGLARVVERFGEDVLNTDGTLDRARLGSLVFSDDAARADLNAIIHPLVRERSRELVAASIADVVVSVIPLLVETGQQDDFDGVLVVDVPVDVQRQRLMERNGLSAAEANRRINSQATRQERLAAATWAVDNSGDRGSTLARLDEVWEEIQALDRSAPPAAR